MSMLTSRFLEYSGDESEGIALGKPETLRVLERVQSLLLYETGTLGPNGDVVRLGQMHGIRVGGSRITFRFAETGRLLRADLDSVRTQLQIGEWELSRTHWAVKDGDIPQELFQSMTPSPKKYDVVLSFAGEDRDYVERVAEYLEAHDVVVFYDKYEEVTLWGKDLAEHLDTVYRKQGRYCIMFISKNYVGKMWTQHERKSSLARALDERKEYVLPVRFDDTDVPGLQPTIGYLDLRKLGPDELGRRILQKLGRK